MSFSGPQVTQTGTPAFLADAQIPVDPRLVVDIAHKAGVKIMEIYASDFAVEHKADSSPLTEADLAANAIIKEELSRLTPSIPILTEESLVAWDVRRTWRQLWVVDPLDGTKEFVNRTDEFTVNIALVLDHKPILGVVHAPALGVTYYASINQGAFKVRVGEEPVSIRASAVSDTGPLKIVGSRSHQSEAMFEFLNKQTQSREINFIKSGSALKFCLVADGTADIYPRLAPTSEWDTAAGHIVVNESGKKVMQFGLDEELVYNKADLLNPWFICS